MPLPLYADECVDGRIVAGLRRRGVDLVTAGDQNLLGASDEQHVGRATQLGRVVVTSDRDFFAIANGLLARGTPFPGLLFIQSTATVGDAVRAIEEVAAFKEPGDMENMIEWIP